MNPHSEPRRSGASRGAAVSVSLRAMTQTEFDPFITRLEADLVADLEQADGMDPAEARGAAEQELRGLLEYGMYTPDHHFRMVIAGDVDPPVGSIWYGPRTLGDETVLWLYEIVIFAGFRNRGYATAALSRLEGVAGESDVGHIALHVFEHNTAAVSLYKGLGYRVDRFDTGHLLLLKRMG